jgi:hypothetical protein
MAIAGERECGKSRFLEMSVILFGGKRAYPYRYMIGRDSHNSDLAKAVLLVIDDENFSTKMDSRKELKASIKQVVAGEGMGVRAMGVERKTLFPLHRMIILLNMERDDLKVLPPIDDGFADKIIMCKGYKGGGYGSAPGTQMPMPTRTAAEKQRFWNRVNAELPYYIWWLQNEFCLPDEMRGRIGITYYHHPEILKELNSMTPEMRLYEYIERGLFDHRGAKAFEGSATELKAALMDEDCPLHRKEKEEVASWDESYLGGLISRLASPSMLGDDRVWQKRMEKGTRRVWWILSQEVSREQYDKKWADRHKRGTADS